MIRINDKVLFGNKVPKCAICTIDPELKILFDKAIDKEKEEMQKLSPREQAYVKIKKEILNSIIVNGYAKIEITEEQYQRRRK